MLFVVSSLVFVVRCLFFFSARGLLLDVFCCSLFVFIVYCSLADVAVCYCCLLCMFVMC